MQTEQQLVTWEYRVVWLEMRQVNVGDVEQNVANMDKELNALGAQGWELVFVQDVGGGKVGNRFAYIFKRQVVKERATNDEPDNTKPTATTKPPQGSPKIDWDSRW